MVEGHKNNSQIFQHCLQKSNALCLHTYEKPKVKDYNYYLIIQRNRVHSTFAQTSVLKALIKFRDYVARLEDESPHQIMPNHVMFNVAAKLPETKNELRDALRQQSQFMKYADELLPMIKRKIENSKEKLQKKKPTHEFFEDVPAAKNPDYVAPLDIGIIEGSLPEFIVSGKKQKK